MWPLIEYIAILAIVLFSITDFFYPLLTGRPLFGSFRKTEKTMEKVEEKNLEAKINEAREKVQEVKAVQGEVTENYKTAEQLKDEADNLLK